MKFRIRVNTVDLLESDARWSISTQSMEFCCVIRLAEGSGTDTVLALIESAKLRVDGRYSYGTLVGSQACSVLSHRRAEKLIIGASNFLRRLHVRGKGI
jgi:hypothetical protein